MIIKKTKTKEKQTNESMQSRFTEDDKGKAGYSLLKFTKSTTFLHDLHSAFTITGNLHC